MRVNTKQVVIIIISAVVVGIILFLLLFPFQKDGPEITNDKISPEGRIFGEINENGIFYQEINYDLFYGHAEDLIGTPFEEKKPSYYSNIDFSNVFFPLSTEACRYFPAFIMYMAMEYSYIPENEMLKYLPKGDIEYQLELERTGFYFEGEIFPYEKSEPPVILGIGVLKETERFYTVNYRLESFSYTQYFEVGESNIIRRMTVTEMEEIRKISKAP